MTAPMLPARYEPRGLLGTGGMGEVWRVWDRERAQELALKRCTRADARLLFKQEFWAMAALPHPHLPTPYDFGGDYFTLELLEGEPPLGQDEAALAGWLPGVLDALAFLHARGYVHGDVKPDNIRQGKLLDLGLLARAGQAGQAPRGTLAYMAPEVIRQEAVDGRADLYALGAVIYHALTGRPPFGEGGNPVALLRAHLEGRPPALTGVSPRLAETVRKLLAKDPADRPATADDVRAALGLAEGGPRRVPLLAPPLLEREAAIGRLQELLQPAGPATLELAGAPGLGKSRLLGLLRTEAQLADLPVLAARGLGPEAAPYEALLPWLGPLAEGAGPALAPLLAAIVPLPGVAPAPPLEGLQEQLRLHGAIATLLAEARPAALFLLDDADALDPASLALLAYLRRAGGPGWRWAEARQAPTRSDAVLLAPLSAGGVAAMAAAMLGGRPAGPVLARVAALADGNPGTVATLLAHWRALDALRPEGGGWVAAAELAPPAGLAESALAGQDEDARRLAHAAGVLGPEGELEGLAAVAELADERLFTALAALAREHVLAVSGSRYHVERAALAGWEPPDAARLHRLAAGWLVDRAGARGDQRLPLADVLALARHWTAAGAADEAARWALEAGQRAIALFALAPAERCLRAALALPQLPPGARPALAALLATVLRLRGGSEEAVALYAGAVLPELRAAGSPQLARELTSYAVALQTRDAYPEALAALAEAINLAEAAGDRETGVRARLYAGRVAYFAGEAGVARTHLAGAARRARETAPSSALCGALSLQGYLLATTEPVDVAAGLALLDEATAIAHALGDVVEEHEAANLRGNVLLALGRFRPAEAAFARCLALCERTGLADETLFARLNLAATSLELGQVGNARRQAELALALAREQGRRFPEGFLLALDGLARVVEGQPAEGLAGVARGLALAHEIANRYLELAVRAYQADALARAGRPEAAREALAAAALLARETGNTEQHDRLQRVELACLTQLRDPAASAAATRAVAEARAAGRAAALAHALRWQAELRLAAGADADELLAEARELARAGGLAGLEAELAWLQGRQALAAGDPAGAADWLEEAERLGSAAGDRVLALAALAAGRGAHDARARLAAEQELEALARELDPAERAAFLARWAPVARVGATDLETACALAAEVRAAEGLAGAMHEAIAALAQWMGADRGALLLYEHAALTEQVFYGPTDGHEEAYSASLAFKVMWEEAPLYLEDVQDVPELAGRASVQALNIRMALGIPLRTSAGTFGVLLVHGSRPIARPDAGRMAGLAEFGRQVAAHLASMRALERAVAAAAEARLLLEAAEELVGLTDRAAAFAGVARAALEASGAERALWLDGPQLACRAAWGADGALAPGSQQVSQGVLAMLADLAAPMQVLDAQAEDALGGRESVLALGLRTILAAPIGGHGVLYLDAARVQEPAPGIERVLGRLAALLAGFLERA